jgi:hypothetical protein
VTAALGYAAGVQHDYFVGVFQAYQAVGNGERRAAVAKHAQGTEQFALGKAIQVGGGFVQNE